MKVIIIVNSTYNSVVYDLSIFGVNKITKAEFCVDGSFDGVDYYVSFNGGKNFMKVLNQNFTIDVGSLGSKIQVRIVFNDNSKYSKYVIHDVGYFHNIQNGTTIFFKNGSTLKVFSTKALIGGSYNISLERGLYEVYTIDNGVKSVITTNYNPELKYLLNKSTFSKELAVELLVKESDWATSCIFDLFSDGSKIGPSSTTCIDMVGNLSDGKTQRSVRYWALLFK